jgi:hypothetical protein
MGFGFAEFVIYFWVVWEGILFIEARMIWFEAFICSFIIPIGFEAWNQIVL